MLIGELEQFRNWKTGKELLTIIESNPDWKCLHIDSYFVMPVRRIPRYCLLVSDYKKYNQQDSNAEIAVKLLYSVGEYINHEVQRAQSAANAASTS